MAHDFFRIRNVTRRPLRVAGTIISAATDGTVLDLNQARVAQELRTFSSYPFEGTRFIGLGEAAAGADFGQYTIAPNKADANLPEGNLFFSTLSTNLAGANNDLTYTAVTAGSGGDGITIRYLDPAGNNQVLSIGVVASAITVNLATGVGGAITSTAASIAAAIALSAPAAALVTVANKTGNDGSGVVIALAATNLAGSTSAGGGFIRWTAMELPRDTTITSLTYYSGTTAANTPTIQYAGVYTRNAAGTTLTRVAQSADLATAAWAANSAKVFTMATPYKTVAGGVHYLALLEVATAVPSLTGRLPFNSVVANLDLAKGYAYSGDGTLIVLPASQAVSGLTAHNQIPFVKII